MYLIGKVREGSNYKRLSFFFCVFFLIFEFIHTCLRTFELVCCIMYILFVCLHACLTRNASQLSSARLSSHRSPYIASPPIYSSISFTHSHSPLKFSFHKETLLSPPLTANTFPLKLHDTRHTSRSNCRTLDSHCPGLETAEEVQMRTVLS